MVSITEAQNSGPSGRTARPRPVRHAPLVRAWRWVVAPRTGPVPLVWALPVAEAVFAALTDTCWTVSGHRRLPDCIHGPDLQKGHDWKHEHAFILPEDADADGLIDHISVAAAMGFDPAALRLLASTDRLVLSNGDAVDLIAERMGSLDKVGHPGPARVWISRTAYDPPNDRPTGGRDASRQLKYEIGKRESPKLLSKPMPLAQIQHGGEIHVPELFHSQTDEGQMRPSKFFFQLEFEQPASGPLAFGWCCHRGLGQFVPVQQSHPPPPSPEAGE